VLVLEAVCGSNQNVSGASVYGSLVRGFARRYLFKVPP